MRSINVRSYQRRTKNGRTTVIRHTRSLQDRMKSKSVSIPKKPHLTSSAASAVTKSKVKQGVSPERKVPVPKNMISLRHPKTGKPVAPKATPKDIYAKYTADQDALDKQFSNGKYYKGSEREKKDLAWHKNVQESQKKWDTAHSPNISDTKSKKSAVEAPKPSVSKSEPYSPGDHYGNLIFRTARLGAYKKLQDKLHQGHAKAQAGHKAGKHSGILSHGSFARKLIETFFEV